jgi:23S rRNA (adenine2503-C2)-methyltransferase
LVFFGEHFRKMKPGTAQPSSQMYSASSKTMPCLLGMSTEEIVRLLEEMGQKPYRGRQISAWIYKHRARSFGEMTDLPLSLREQLSAAFSIGRGEVLLERKSCDGTVKLLLGLRDGESVECVYLPYEGRDSVCVSTQVGCPVACAFCATGLMGFRRNLTAGEIVEQVLVAQDIAVREQGENARISNVVFMGMGEPLLNLEATVKAMKLINSELGISMRSLTVSTVGVIPAIRRLAEYRLPFTLAVSLHAPEQKLREQIVPLARRYPLDELLQACHEYAEITGRRVTYEYVMLAGVNDSLKHARRLGMLLKGELAHVNLIPYNPCPEIEGFEASPPEQIQRFQEELERCGVRATARVPRGRDIEAACGQLKGSLAGRKALGRMSEGCATSERTL